MYTLTNRTLAALGALGFILSFLALCWFAFRQEGAPEPSPRSTPDGPRLPVGFFRLWRFSISPNGTEMAVAGVRDGEQTTILWDFRSGREIKQFPSREQSTGLAFTPDGLRLATGDTGDGDITVWDRARGWAACFHRRDPDYRCANLTFTPDGRRLAIAGWPGNIVVLRLADGRKTVLGKLPFIGRHTAFSSDGALLAATDTDSRIQAWDLKTGAVRMSVDAHIEPVTHCTGVKGAFFLPDSRTLLTGGTDGVVRFWDVQNNRQQAPVHCNMGKIESMALSSDGKLLAVGFGATSGIPLAGGGEGGSIRIWRVPEREELLAIEPLPAGAGCLGFTPDGRWLIASLGGKGDNFKAWDVMKLLADRANKAN